MVDGVKQTKLGFDKNFAQKREVDEILVGVRGNLLRDQNGDFLYTKDEKAPPAYFTPEKSVSAVINNEYTPELQPYEGSLATIEQFPTLSEVSSSLLGIPRIGKQQSLLADVSVYGLNDDTWEYFAKTSGLNPQEWGLRKTPTYGRRYRPKLVEYEKESALSLEMFPVPYSFPSGPNFKAEGRYEAGLFAAYLRFVELGNLLYDYYTIENPEYADFAEKNFLSSNLCRVRDDEIVEDNVNENDVIYDYDLNNIVEQEAVFFAIEKWTLAWMDIRDNRLRDPITDDLLNANFIFNFLTLKNKRYDFTGTRPGYASNVEWYAQLTSKEAFRYQPGAISGFTFGLRLNSDPSSESVKIEWGGVNETDHYVFQVSGAKFNIVRRSTTPLSRESLALMGKLPEDQTIEPSPNPAERPGNAEDNGIADAEEFSLLYETVWNQDEFNGDGLNGNQEKSGYTLSFNEVTMYKIEFSWYGAIGAKFYAYIPVGNGDARWVLLHTILIENMLEFPSLKNPYMKFRYSLRTEDNSTLREPIFVYKYGASYYIDGDDEGTYVYNNYSSKDNKPITSFNSVPVMGFQPKDEILNSDGIGIPSQKNFYFDRISVNSTVNSRVDILQCEGCQNGFGHYYAPGLVNGERGIQGRFRINASGNLEYVDGTQFTQDDNGKHIIADGVYCSYIDIPENQQNLQSLPQVGIKRRNGAYNTGGGYNTDLNDTVTGTNSYQPGSLIETANEFRGALNYEFDGVLTGYDDIVASVTPVTKSTFFVQFLNPESKRNITREFSHYNQFRIGVTDKIPTVENVNGEDVLLFDGEPLDMDKEIFGQWVPYVPIKNLDGYESAEGNIRFGDSFIQDPRIDQPPGERSGYCSELKGKLEIIPIIGVEFVTELNTTEGIITGNILRFDLQPEVIDVDGAEVGIWDGVRFVGSDVRFTTDIIEYSDPGGGNGFYAKIDQVLDLTQSVTDDGRQQIATKSLRLTGRWIDRYKAFSFDTQSFYVWIAMQDLAEINNISIYEFDQLTSNSFIPNWLKGQDCNIVVQNVNAVEFFDLDGQFNMGGASSTNLSAAAFDEKNRLDSIKVDTTLTQPLRPGQLKSSIFVGENQTEIIDMEYLFSLDKLKLTTGTFNRGSMYLSAIAIEQGTSGSININVNGKEQ